MPNFWFEEIPRRGRDGKPWTSYRAFVRVDPDNPNKRISAVFKSDTAALEWVGEQLSALKQGTWNDPTKRKRPFNYYADIWRTVIVKLRPGTRGPYEQLLKNHVGPTFGTKKVGNITETDVEVFLAAKLRDGYRPKYVNEMLNVLHGVLETARKDRAIAQNPAVGKRLTVPEREVDVFTMDQLVTFVEQVTPWYRPAVWLMIFTGMRPGEMCGLLISDVDFDSGEVRIKHTFAPVPALDEVPFHYAEGPVKTDAGKRKPYIPEFVFDQLLERVRARDLDRKSHEPLFLNMEGSRVKRDTFNAKIIKPAAKRAGLPSGFRAYDLRHNNISLLIELGANLKAVSQHAGHTSDAFTLRRYTHTLPDAQQKLTALLEQARQEVMEARSTGAAVIPFQGRRRAKEA